MKKTAHDSLKKIPLRSYISSLRSDRLYPVLNAIRGTHTSVLPTTETRQDDNEGVKVGVSLLQATMAKSQAKSSRLPIDYNT